MPLISFWNKCLGDDDEFFGLFLPLYRKPDLGTFTIIPKFLLFSYTFKQSYVSSFQESVSFIFFYLYGYYVFNLLLSI
jgi:hypothetical protein